ncbi:MAG TPA: hypothetical protein VMD04_04535 [Candidatus Margulisiibacteriota bacterium]|nr:hypothetical protein [Candidatus Margulisiibacteriota bacterium]
MRRNKDNGESSSPKARYIPFKLVSLLLIILLVISISLGYIWRILTTSDYFRIEEVINQESKKADLSYLKGRNIFSVDLKGESLLILGFFPDYSEVKLVRLLPNKIFVLFSRRKPVALVRLYKYFALDKDGVFFFAPSDPKELDLPLITGLETKIFGAKPGTRYNNKEILLALTVIRESKRNRVFKGYKIKRIDLANPASASLFIPVEHDLPPDPWGSKKAAVDNLEVRLGSENIKARLNILGNLLMNSKNELSNTRYIDLRFKEPVIKLKDAK